MNEEFLDGGARRHVEHLSHFSCRACSRWWTIGDAPDERIEWFCPWCGKRQEV